jgi:tetratricopeptide (TPR) repeat protein
VGLGANELERLFYQGDYAAVLKLTVDAPKGESIRPSQLSYVIASLTFLGRVGQGQLLFEQNESKMSVEARAAARCFLGSALCRQSEYRKALAHFIANLKVSKSTKNQRVQMFTYHGIAFYRYFCGRYPLALAAANKAYKAALKSNYIFGKFLVCDMIGHALIVTGQVSSGLKMLQEALHYSQAMGNGEDDDAVRISLACYHAEFGNSPDKDLATLQKFYDSLSPQDTYSQASLLLEIGRQLALRGKLNASQSALNQACRLIYSSGHRRQSVILNLRYAYNLMLSGEDHQALNLVRTAAKSFDPRVDKALELHVLGFEYRLKSTLGLTCDNDPLKKRIRDLTLHTGMGTARRILYRSEVPGTITFLPGEDPLGDLYDRARSGNENCIGEILNSGYLGLLYTVLPIAPSNSILYFDLIPGSLLICHRGNLDFIRQGVSPSMRALIKKLIQGECSKKELIETVWGYKYDPLRHDSLIYPAISRLRLLLGERGNWIEATQQGYRLSGQVQVRFHRSMNEVDGHPYTHTHTPANEDVSTLDVLNYRQIALLKKLKPDDFLDVQRYKKMFSISQITATRDLSALTALGILKRTGNGRATRYLMHPKSGGEGSFPNLNTVTSTKMGVNNHV